MSTLYLPVNRKEEHVGPRRGSKQNEVIIVLLEEKKSFRKIQGRKENNTDVPENWGSRILPGEKSEGGES